MAFIKPVTIYEKGSTKVFINQCHAKGKKTKVFAIRRDDKTGLSQYLGSIVFNPRWRQYVFQPEQNTQWCDDCLEEIVAFMAGETWEWRQKIRNRNKGDEKIMELLPKLTDGFKRKYYQCSHCKQVQAHDFVPYSLETQLEWNPCRCQLTGHNTHLLKEITSKEFYEEYNKKELENNE
jgi:hypothetical protein